MPRPFPCRRTLLTMLAMPPALCGRTADYVTMWRPVSSGRCWDVRFDKRRKEAHRFTIADTRGRLDLTVPIVKPETHLCLWSDIEVSDHGAWWDVHRVALESAYGRTPYFEFYIDRFLPMLTAGVTDRFPRLEQLARAWEGEIRQILGLGPEAEYLAPRCPLPARQAAPLPPYWQVRQDKLGFIDGLSILDIIFNLGPEAQIYLNDTALSDR